MEEKNLESYIINVEDLSDPRFDFKGLLALDMKKYNIEIRYPKRGIIKNIYDLYVAMLNVFHDVIRRFRFVYENKDVVEMEFTLNQLYIVTHLFHEIIDQTHDFRLIRSIGYMFDMCMDSFSEEEMNPYEDSNSVANTLWEFYEEIKYIRNVSYVKCIEASQEDVLIVHPEFKLFGENLINEDLNQYYNPDRNEYCIPLEKGRHLCELLEVLRSTVNKKDRKEFDKKMYQGVVVNRKYLGDNFNIYPDKDESVSELIMYLEDGGVIIDVS